MSIDTTFDFRSDSNGRDPDAFSKTLKRYHQILWSKPLPNGLTLELEPIGSYLAFRFNMQTIKFGSDSISNSYMGTKKIAHLKDQISQPEFEEFRDKGSTIGGYLIFPSEREGGKMTINGARGFNSKIADRFDLTLECIRRHYQRQQHPLESTFNSPINKFFFSLFKDFQGYVDFFLLQDLVDNNYEVVNFFTALRNDFAGSPIPETAAEYRAYKDATLEFVTQRNVRIDHWDRGNF